MKEYLEEYVEILLSQGKSESYVKSVRNRLQFFFNYLKSGNIEEVNAGVMMDFRQFLLEEYRTAKGERLKLSTIQERCIAIKAYSKYLTQKKFFLFNPAVKLEIPKGERLSIETVPTHEEVVGMIERINPKSPWAERDRAILELLYSSGLRGGELRNLNLYDIDFGAGKVTVRQGKGRKDRMVPLGKKAACVLREYVEGLRRCEVRDPKETALFFDKKGRRLSRYNLWEIVHKLKQNRKITVHGLRHACAIGMLRGGADIRYIQEMLGHKDLTTTQIYTKLMPLDLEKAAKKYHPRRRWSHA